VRWEAEKKRTVGQDRRGDERGKGIPGVGGATAGSGLGAGDGGGVVPCLTLRGSMLRGTTSRARSADEGPRAAEGFGPAGVGPGERGKKADEEQNGEQDEGSHIFILQPNDGVFEVPLRFASPHPPSATPPHPQPAPSCPARTSFAGAGLFVHRNEVCRSEVAACEGWVVLTC
jgi:hypothetical protein